METGRGLRERSLTNIDWKRHRILKKERFSGNERDLFEMNGTDQLKSVIRIRLSDCGLISRDCHRGRQMGMFCTCLTEWAIRSHWVSRSRPKSDPKNIRRLNQIERGVF